MKFMPTTFQWMCLSVSCRSSVETSRSCSVAMVERVDESVIPATVVFSSATSEAWWFVAVALLMCQPYPTRRR